jgi:hypothetical protein
LQDEIYYQSNMLRGGIDHAMEAPMPQQNYVAPTYQEQAMPYLVFASPGYSAAPEPEPEPVATPVFVEPAPVAQPEPEPEPVSYDPIGMNATFINMAFQQVFPNFTPPEPEPTMVGNGINELVEIM